MKNVLYYFGLICIAIMLFILHSAFAYSIIPIFLAEEFFSDLFVTWNGIDLKIIFPYIFGSAFAFAISSIMALLEKDDTRFWSFAISVALMELIGIALLVYPYHGDVWIAISGIYYGFYLFLAIIFYFYIKPNTKDSQVSAKIDSRKIRANTNNANDAKVLQMLKDDLNPKQISEELNINLSTVYRIKKRYENEQNRMDK